MLREKQPLHDLNTILKWWISVKNVVSVSGQHMIGCIVRGFGGGGGGKFVLTITPQTHQTTIITLSDKIKTQEKGNKQQFHHCSYEVHNP